MKVIAAEFGKRAAPDLSRVLRDIADAVDRGEIVDFIAAYTQNDEYKFVESTSLSNALELATLMQRRCVDKFII